MDLSESSTAALASLVDHLWDADNVFNPAYLVWTVIIALMIRMRERNAEPLRSYLFPRETYSHPSMLTDLKCAAFNFFFIGFGFLTFANVASLVSYLITTRPEAGTKTPLALGLLISLVLILAMDLGRYLSHRLHHRVAFFWPFHAVHHSAEVLTPITASRAHPMYFVMNTMIISALVGIVLGLGIRLLAGPVDGWVFVGPAIALPLYFFCGAHLRHSHLWLAYPVWLEHILISPAQHQIHHSTDLRHRDKNFGEIFALWDWMFGTLYVTSGREALTFGLSDKDGRLLPQTYPSFRAAIIQPFKESARTIPRPKRESRKLV